MSTALEERRASDAYLDGQWTTRSLRAIGTSAAVAVTDSSRADDALGLLAGELAALDAACSRFRPDSELRRLERCAHGGPLAVSLLLYELLEVGCAVAGLTAGTVDPTVGHALAALGYDRDFDQVRASGASGPTPASPAPGWWRIALDPVRMTAAIPAGVSIDLGATAKAFAADRAASRIAEWTGCGVLVNLGGDVAVAGPPPEGGWTVGVATECSASPSEVDEVVALTAGGLATSGTTSRVWSSGGRRVHHIVDPWTGEPADPVWSLVSTIAASCVEANAFSTAAVVWGSDAPGNLAGHRVSARLVAADGSVERIGGWPHPGAAPDRRKGPR